ncbi:MAG TPA: ATP-binding protein, partial [Pirellula sp.]|nr:ATP-binding protein [Pirellula sp.]
MSIHTSCLISDISQVGETRRIGLRLAEFLNLTESQLGSIAIIITELATNLVRHAKSGQILMRASVQCGFEVFSIDKGPGMDLARCLEDGYSTGGTAGNGMGA